MSIYEWYSDVQCWDSQSNIRILVGGLEHFLFSHILGIIILIDLYFSDGLEPPTSCDVAGFWGSGFQQHEAACAAGQDVVKHLLQSSDVLIENFKAGGLAKKLGKRSFRVPGCQVI